MSSFETFEKACREETAYFKKLKYEDEREPLKPMDFISQREYKGVEDENYTMLW